VAPRDHSQRFGILEALVVHQVCAVGWSDWETREPIERAPLALTSRSPGVPKRGHRGSGRAPPRCANGVPRR
jgi:hypothetical protein